MGGEGERRGGRRGWGALEEGGEALPPAHLCNHADAPHDDGGFGLSPTHPAEPGGDEDLPGQVLDAQVPPPGVQYGELRGKDSGSRSTPARSPLAHGQARPVSHHRAVDDALGTDVAVTARRHLAVPAHRGGSGVSRCLGPHFPWPKTHCHHPKCSTTFSFRNKGKL